MYEGGVERRRQHRSGKPKREQGEPSGVVEERRLAEPEHAENRQNYDHDKHQAISNRRLGKYDRAQDRGDGDEHGRK